MRRSPRLPLALLSAVASLVATLPARPARAWSNHTILTLHALADEPGLARAAPIAAEPLAAYVEREQASLAGVLDEIEAWARGNVANYPPRPDGLRFAAAAPGAPADDGRRRLLEAIRANPTYAARLIVQLVPGGPTAGLANPGRPVDEKELLPAGALAAIRRRFVEVKAGDPLPPLLVVATASDEPDYGLDIGLFADNGTEYGRRFGWGEQSLGNPALPFASQTPFHMGFFHETGVVYRLAPFVRRMYPEYRIRLFLALARHAFRTGHPYWGWRFAGWALHYVQDLAQPYHASLVPGFSTGGALGRYVVGTLGWKRPQEGMVTLVSNRHLVLEDLALALLARGLDSPDTAPASDGIVRALRDVAADAGVRDYDDRSPREVIARAAHGHAAAVDEVIRTRVPSRYAGDPSYIYSITEPNVDVLAAVRASPESLRAIADAVAMLLRETGTHTRKLVAAALR